MSIFQRSCCAPDAQTPLPKTLSFAVLHFSIAFTVAYLLTGSVLTGGLIALIEPACNTVAFYFHEKLWMRRGAATVEERGHGHGNLACSLASRHHMDQGASRRAQSTKSVPSAANE